MRCVVNLRIRTYIIPTSPHHPFLSPLRLIRDIPVCYIILSETHSFLPSLSEMWFKNLRLQRMEMRVKKIFNLAQLFSFSETGNIKFYILQFANNAYSHTFSAMDTLWLGCAFKKITS